MAKRVLKAWSDKWLRRKDEDWLLLHKHGDYEYRNPDSVFVHCWETFRTREDAIAYLDDRIPRAERHEWRLYQVVAA